MPKFLNIIYKALSIEIGGRVIGFNQEAQEVMLSRFGYQGLQQFEIQGIGLLIERRVCHVLG